MNDMIQFRWRKLDSTHHGYENTVTVNGYPCVLEFKQLFMPAMRAVKLPNGQTAEITVLEVARPCDQEWKEVTIK